MTQSDKSLKSMWVCECPRRFGRFGPDEDGKPGFFASRSDGGRGNSGGGGGEDEPPAEKHDRCPGQGLIWGIEGKFGTRGYEVVMGVFTQTAAAPPKTKDYRRVAVHNGEIRRSRELKKREDMLGRERLNPPFDKCKSKLPRSKSYFSLCQSPSSGLPFGDSFAAPFRHWCRWSWAIWSHVCHEITAFSIFVPKLEFLFTFTCFAFDVYSFPIYPEQDWAEEYEHVFAWFDIK